MKNHQSHKLNESLLHKIRVAVIGTQGVPASYGGFESLVDNILGENCPENVEYTVFCSSKDLPQRLESYKGARLKYVPLHANGMQSIPYDIWSMCRAVRGYDVILILGVSGCLFLPVLRAMTRSKIIVNIDGLEHRRDKWGKLARTILRQSEAMAVRFADVIISDNKGIQNYVTETYGRPSELIAYGGDHVHRNIAEERIDQILSDYKVERGQYAITVCRIEPENNSQIILEAFAESGKPLIFIGNWNHSDWSRNLRQQYAHCPNIQMLDAIYDLDILYALRSQAGTYIHGHSAGGTNPSLVEAMHFGMPILAFDVVYNRETTENQAYYFGTAAELAALTRRTDLNGNTMIQIARQRYTWPHIANQYCNLYAK